MLECEGYKMFHGSALISPCKSSGVKPFRMTGDWLYKPEYGCWYVGGHSYSENIVSDFQEEAKTA